MQTGKHQVFSHCILQFYVINNNNNDDDNNNNNNNNNNKMAALDLLKFNLCESNKVYNLDTLCVSGMERN